MIIPWGTDAPIYHRPAATIGLIVVNVGSFCAFPAGSHEEWTLVLGEGLHPLQWVTSLFMHLGFGHLIGNMVFLWAFGIIVEGKLGWRVFLTVYLGIGLVESAVFQALIRTEHPIFMLGASGVIFALLAMCLVWAPRNELQCVTIFRLLPMEFDFPILWVAVLYIGLEALEAGITGFAASSALAHLGGAVLGLIVAIAFLKLDLVDCENWDLFAVLERRTGQSKKQAQKARITRPRVFSERVLPEVVRRDRRARNRAPLVRSMEDAAASALRTMRRHLELGEAEAALAVYKNACRSHQGWWPPERDWRDLMEALLYQSRWDDAALVMRDYLRTLDAPSPRVRLKLAQVLTQKLGRPVAALRVLGQIPEGSLPHSLESIRRQLANQAQGMQEDGPLELDDETW
jgi:membrane associated rhomboid family serine protease